VPGRLRGTVSHLVTRLDHDRRRRLKFVLITVFALTACFDPKLSDNPICGPGEDNCPTDRKCLGGRCVTAGCGELPDREPCFQGGIADGICLEHACVPRGCGDGIPDETNGEVCDDGNRTPGDGCSALCDSVETCGNGVVDFSVGEQCDPGDPSSATQCNSTGTLACQIPRCGDGVVDAQNGENCDLGAANSMAVDAACRPNCQPRRCSDGVQDTGEACDDSNLLSGDGCSGDCLSRETCGNEYVDITHGEQCDSGVPGLSGDGCSSTCTAEFASWTDVSPRAIAQRFGAAVEYDRARHQLVLFGGTSTDGTLADTWVLDQDIWTQQFPTHSPPPHRFHSLVFDPVRNVVVLFGGRDQNDVLGDTWTFDGQDWTEVSSPAAPVARQGHAIAFDPISARIVLFGGFGGAALGDLTDTWTFDGSTWTPTITAHSPPSAGAGDFTFDPVTGHMLLFRGTGNNATDTWVFDGTDWAPIPTSAGPPAGGDRLLRFDSSLNRVVLVALDQIWGFASGQWSPIVTSIAPPDGPGRFGHALAFDPDANRVVMFGGVANGLRNDTWSLRNAQWSELVAFSTPPARRGHAVAFDSARSRVFVFGGFSTEGSATLLGDTWLFDTASWRENVTSPAPPARFDARVVFDEQRSRMVLFGGSALSSAFRDTWSFDGARWSQLFPQNAPSARSRHAMTWDSATRFIVLFGGGVPGFGGNNETWRFDGTNWTRVFTADAPSPRLGAAMTFDELHQQIVLFGGFDPAVGKRLADTWIFRNNNWIQVPTSGGPSPREDHSMTFDSVSGRVVLFGGDEPGTALNDLWAFDGSTWIQLETAARPPGRTSTGFTFDRARDRLVLFGGISNVDLGDTWSFSPATFPARETCTTTFDGDHDGLLGCEDPDCAGFCTPSCSPHTDRYDHRPISASHPAPPACDLSAGQFCGDLICQPPRETAARCPIDCPPI
jgi:cysteine-rich repeat protein